MQQTERIRRRPQSHCQHLSHNLPKRTERRCEHAACTSPNNPCAILLRTEMVQLCLAKEQVNFLKAEASSHGAPGLRLRPSQPPQRPGLRNTLLLFMVKAARQVL
ncbi:hypothetical protein AGIG_G5452 [Arapaima gigas]